MYYNSRELILTKKKLILMIPEPISSRTSEKRCVAGRKI